MMKTLLGWIRGKASPSKRSLIEEYNQLQYRPLYQRIIRDLEEGNNSKAINRLEGFLQSRLIDQEVHYQLAKLYMQVGNEIKAGKHLYFREKPTPEESTCILAFEQSLGGCPINIAKKLLYKHSYTISECSPYLKRRHFELIQAIEAKFHVTPKFLQGIKRHLEKSLK